MDRTINDAPVVPGWRLIPGQINDRLGWLRISTQVADSLVSPYGLSGSVVRAD